MEVTIMEVIGANIRELREARAPKMTQNQLRQILRDDFGIKWAETGMWRLEKGERQLDATELSALATVFDRPIWYFFVPPAKLMGASVGVADRKRPAHELLTELLRPEKPTHQVAFRAYEIAVALEKNGGDKTAQKSIMAALGNTNFPQTGGSR